MTREMMVIFNPKYPFGKFFCWHDYTYMGMNHNPLELMMGLRFIVGCIKCGKLNKHEVLPIEPIVNKL